MKKIILAALLLVCIGTLRAQTATTPFIQESTERYSIQYWVDGVYNRKAVIREINESLWLKGFYKFPGKQEDHSSVFTLKYFDEGNDEHVSVSLKSHGPGLTWISDSVAVLVIISHSFWTWGESLTDRGIKERNRLIPIIKETIAQAFKRNKY